MQKERAKKAKEAAKADKEKAKQMKAMGAEHAKKEKEWECPTYPVQRVAIAKRDAQAFGMTFIGPDPGMKRTGVYITGVKDDGAAAAAGGIEEGMKIMAMNGQPMASSDKQEAVELLKGAVSAIMTIQKDPVGYAFYDKGALLDSIKEGAIGKAPDGFGGFDDDAGAGGDEDLD